MSAKYGITSAMADVVGGYEQEQERQMGLQKAERGAQMDEMKLQQMRGQLEKEGVADSVRLMLAGDMEGAMEKYNAMGEDRMSDLEFDQESGLVSFTDSEGNERGIMIGQLMASAGIDPRTLDTPEKKHGRDKELIEHRAKMAKKYGIGKGGAKPTAYIQNLEYLMKSFTGGDPRKAMELYTLSNEKPLLAKTRILDGLRRANESRRRSEKWSEGEMDQMARDSVSSFRNEMFDRLMGPEKKPTGKRTEYVTKPTEDEALPAFDPNNPSALWR